MEVSNVSASGGASAGANATQIAQLQKQLKVLSKELQAAATDTGLDPKARALKVKLLQAQILAVQQEIAALAQQQQRPHLVQASASQQPMKRHSPKPTGHIALVDHYV